LFRAFPHVTQWGNGRQKVFFRDSDYAIYRDLLAASCRKAKVECWAWVAMPNDVHFILTPRDADRLRAALAPTQASFMRGASAPGISGRAALAQR
jgi:putative transposase